MFLFGNVNTGFTRYHNRFKCLTVNNETAENETNNDDKGANVSLKLVLKFTICYSIKFYKYK